LGEEAFLEAVMGMRSKLYHVAMAILWSEQDAADAVQEAMLKAWQRRGGLRDEERFEAWFTRILVNQCRDMQRCQIRRRRLMDEARQRQLSEASAAPNSELFEAIHDLPEKLRLPVILYYFDGYSQRETGSILGISEAQVKGRVRQAREKLRLDLKADGALTDGEGRRNGHE